MEIFRFFLRAIGLLQPAKTDFITELPLEVSQLILRKLDPETLLCAAQVSRKWLKVCCSDREIRKTARLHLEAKNCEDFEEFVDPVPPVPEIRAIRKVRTCEDIRYAPIRVDTAELFGGSGKFRGSSKFRSRVPSPIGLRRVRSLRI